MTVSSTVPPVVSRNSATRTGVPDPQEKRATRVGVLSVIRWCPLQLRRTSNTGNWKSELPPESVDFPGFLMDPLLVIGVRMFVTMHRHNTGRQAVAECHRPRLVGGVRIQWRSERVFR